jgi:hypothetical protein
LGNNKWDDGSGGVNDEISSIKIEGYRVNSRIKVYENDWYGGKGEIFIYGDKNLRGNYIGNDSISSIKIVGNAEAILYESKDYGGKRLKVVMNETRIGHAPEDKQDMYFNDIFEPIYDRLANILPNWKKANVPVWNEWTKPKHNSWFQNFAFSYGDYHFIFLDFNDRDDAPHNAPGAPGRATLYNGNHPSLKWLKNHLSDLLLNPQPQNENILLFAHHPLDSRGAIYWEPFTDQDEERMRKFLHQYRNNVDKWFAGHTHKERRYDKYYNNTNILECIEIDEAYMEGENYNVAGDYTIVQIFDDRIYPIQLCGNVYDGRGGPLTDVRPYLVTCDVTVPDGQTLTINPGVKIYFEPGCKIIANGTLIANGEPNNPISFLLADAPHHGMKLYRKLILKDGGWLRPGGD